MTNDDRKTPTTAEVRATLARARADDDAPKGPGDETDATPPPAASPLGTDAEAGGHGATAKELRIARRQEARRGDETPGSGGGD